MTRCPECNYDLRGLPADYACPECGFTYDADTVVFASLGGFRRNGLAWFVLFALQIGVMSIGSAMMQPFLGRTGWYLTAIMVLYDLRQYPRRSAFAVLRRKTLLYQSPFGKRIEIKWSEIASVDCSAVWNTLYVYDAGGKRLITIRDVTRGDPEYAFEIMSAIRFRARGGSIGR